MKPLVASCPFNVSKIPLFLAPAFAECSTNPSNVRTFTSTTCKNERRRRRDMSRNRGVSAMRSTGTRKPLSVDRLYPKLPVPRPEKERPVDDFPINPDHGLYGFFNKEKKVVIKDEDESQHGRCWEYKELMFKSFQDLHQLYWTCILESNIIATRYGELKRMKLGYGHNENQERAKEVKKTMRNIREVLRDRQLAFEEARILMAHNNLEHLLKPAESTEGDTHGGSFEEAPDSEARSESPTISPAALPSGGLQPRERVIGPRPTN